jgi:hypothetical protein
VLVEIAICPNIRPIKERIPRVIKIQEPEIANEAMAKFLTGFRSAIQRVRRPLNNARSSLKYENESNQKEDWLGIDYSFACKHKPCKCSNQSRGNNLFK